MTVGPMGFLEDDTDIDPNSDIDDCWMYDSILMNLPPPGAEGHIP